MSKTNETKRVAKKKQKKKAIKKVTPPSSAETNKVIKAKSK